MDPTLQQLSQLIVSRRKELNIKQEELADITQIAIRTIRDLEKGMGNPSFQTIRSVMEVLGIELVFQLKNEKY